jgi:hypothetical protein
VPLLFGDYLSHMEAPLIQDGKAATDEGSTGTLHVREDREEVVARAVRLAGELQTVWEVACTVSAPRLRPVPDALQPFDYYNSVLGRPRLVLAPMVCSNVFDQHQGHLFIYLIVIH